MLITNGNHSTIIANPLDQFEIRDFLSFNAQILGDINISITNIGLYLIIVLLVAAKLNIFPTNYEKVGTNN